MAKKIHNFYVNIIKGTLIDNLIHKPGFWIITLTSIFSAIFFDDKYFFLCAGSVYYILYKLNIYIETKSKLDSIQMYDENIPNILDHIIEEAFNEYFLFNKGFEKNKEYINASEEQEILNKMVDSVSARLSESTLAKLEAYYNKDMVPNIISNKIYMAITSYVSQNNTPVVDTNMGINKDVLRSMNNLSEDENEVVTRYL